jgi:hypothetical protein
MYGSVKESWSIGERIMACSGTVVFRFLGRFMDIGCEHSR